MLKLSNKDFKGTIVKILWWSLLRHLTQIQKMEKLSKEIERRYKEQNGILELKNTAEIKT